MSLRRFVAIVAIAASALSGLVAWAYPSRTDFRPPNPFWNGLGRFASEWHVARLRSLAQLPEDPRATAVVVIPYRGVAQADGERLRRYVDAGGVLVLLDDYGFGNHVLDALGLRLRLTGEPLVDPLFYQKNRRLPKITDLPALRAPSTMVLNHATSLAEASGATVLARSSAYSFLDLNGDGDWGEDEPRGPFPVAASVSLGKGTVAVIADPSLLINGTIELGDNRAFLRQVVRLAGERPQVFLDEAHLPAARLDVAKDAIGVAQSRVADPVTLLVLVVVALAAPVGTALFRRRRSSGPHA